jgi:hypothetical protein
MYPKAHEKHGWPITSVHESGEFVASGDREGHIKIWDFDGVCPKPSGPVILLNPDLLRYLLMGS